LLGKKQVGHLTFFNYVTGITLGSIRFPSRTAIILDFNPGVIAEAGTHEELMAAKGLYPMPVSQPA